MKITKVDSYYFATSYRQQVQALRQADPDETPWTPLTKPLSECKVALVSSAGIHLKTDETFDYDRERRQPTWGDPTHREIPIPLYSGQGGNVMANVA